MATALRDRIVYINSENVIVNLFRADQKKYLTLNRIYCFVAYLRQQIETDKESDKYTRIVININSDDIERTVYYNNQMYDLIGNKIIIKGVLPINQEEDFLSILARKFSIIYTV